MQPEGGLPIYKFENFGDAILAKLMGRRKAVKTKAGPGTALDVDIIEYSDGETSGPHTMFESGGISKIFDQHQPNPGDVFFLEFCERVKDSRFKRFAFQLDGQATGNGNGENAEGDEIGF